LVRLFRQRIRSPIRTVPSRIGRNYRKAASGAQPEQSRSIPTEEGEPDLFGDAFANLMSDRPTVKTTTEPDSSLGYEIADLIEEHGGSMEDFMLYASHLTVSG